MFSNLLEDIRQQFRQGGVIVWLMAICIGVFLVFETIRIYIGATGGTSATYDHIYRLFALPARAETLLSQPWSLISFMFMHANIGHLLMNMYALYVFGEVYELYMRQRRLLPIFVVGSLVGGLLIMACSYILPTLHSHIGNIYSVGASAGIYAIIFATTALHPAHRLRLFMVFEIPIWGLAIGLLLLSYVAIADSHNAGGMIGHIGGALFGFLYIKALQSGIDWFMPLDRIAGAFNPSSKLKATHVRSRGARVEKKDLSSGEQKRLDDILDKISRSGYNSLSKEEKEFLFKYSNK